MVVTPKISVRSFNGIHFYTMDETTASHLFWSEEMECGYAYGREVTTGSILPNKVLQRTLRGKRSGKPAKSSRSRR